MPTTQNEYYRYQRIYTEREWQGTHFTNLLEYDRETMTRSLPKNCDEYAMLLYNYSIEEDIYSQRCLIYKYFEREEDMVISKAIDYKDDDIYKSWRRRRREQDALDKYTQEHG